MSDLSHLQMLQILSHRPLSQTVAPISRSVYLKKFRVSLQSSSLGFCGHGRAEASSLGLQVRASRPRVRLPWHSTGRRNGCQDNQITIN